MGFTTFGEIMLRLTPSNHAGKINTAQSFGVHYAGSESNVASSLAILGNTVQFVTKIPLNGVGDGCMMSLQNFGISTKNILRGGARIGTYFVEIGLSIRPSSVIYDRADSAISAIHPNEFDWETILKGQQWLFISGITPALSKNCAEETIKVAKIAKQMGVKVSFDMNFRRTLWKDKSDARTKFDAILEHTDLLFGNAGVLKDVYDIEAKGNNTLDTTLDALETAKKQFGLEQLAFTVRNHNSASENILSGVCSMNGKTMVSNKYRVEIMDRFGTGDAFAAGFLHGLGKEWDVDKTLGFATAAFALKHTIKGDQHTSSEKEIISIMEGNTSGHVIR
ncbi:PfkB family carbohydrate kinase [Maribacter sp. 2210JD10-5]|uniref:PfkB family carbohydrate kinase n=1 Tax=Maribacter sp. 2210JD10-5 TaxID=3386272 RepID=UPI0039BCCF6C